MSEMHLRKLRFIYSTNNKENSFWRNRRLELRLSKRTIEKAWRFQHDMTYGNFKDLIRRTASDKILRDKAFNIAKNPKTDGYQRGLASMVYKLFDNIWQNLGYWSCWYAINK